VTDQYHVDIMRLQRCGRQVSMSMTYMRTCEKNHFNIPVAYINWKTILRIFDQSLTFLNFSCFFVNFIGV